MEGPFTLAATGCCVEAARLEQARPGFARRAGPTGACSFGYFSCTSKKSNSPAGTAARSKKHALKRAKKPFNGYSKVLYQDVENVFQRPANAAWGLGTERAYAWTLVSNQPGASKSK